MPLILRTGTGSETLIAASAVAAYRNNKSTDDNYTSRRPKTRRQMKSKIVRGALGASLRGSFTVPCVGESRLIRE